MMKLLLLFIPFLLVSCVTSSDLELLRRDMQLESLNNKREIQALKDKLSEVSKDVAILKEYSLSAIKDSHSSLLGQTNELSKDVQIIRGRLDENKFFLDKTLKEHQTEREILSARINALEKEIKELKAKQVAPPPTPETPAQNQPAQTSSSNENTAKTPVTNDQRLYDDAQIDFKDNKFDSARIKFDKFIRENPQHTLVPNAMFWSAESYYEMKKYEEAVLGYENFIKKNPTHERVKVALLKQGYCFLELKDPKTAKVIFERVIEKYPRSEEAKLAEKKISEILHKKNSPDKSRKKK